MLTVTNLIGFDGGGATVVKPGDMPGVTWQVLCATALARTAYSGGNCFQAHKSVSTTQNIGFVAGVADWASANTFWGGATGDVSTWYDQSGSGNDLTGSATRPLGDATNHDFDFGASGTFLSNSVTTAAPYFVFASFNFTGSLAASPAIYALNSGGAADTVFAKTGPLMEMKGGANFTASFTGSAWHYLSANFVTGAGASTLRIDGNATTGTTTPGGNAGFVVGASGGDPFLLDFFAVTSSSLNAAQIANVEAWIGANTNS